MGQVSFVEDVSDLPHSGSDGLRELVELVVRGADDVLQEVVLAGKHVLLPEAVVPEGVQVVEGLVSQLRDGPGPDVAGGRQVVGGPDELPVGEELPERMVVGAVQVRGGWRNRLCDLQAAGMMGQLSGRSYFIARQHRLLGLGLGESRSGTEGPALRMERSLPHVGSSLCVCVYVCGRCQRWSRAGI